MRLVTALLVGAIVGACARDPLEDHLDGTPYCRAHCGQAVECGRLGDEHEQQCFEDCMNDGPADGWEGPCNELLAGYHECTNVLTCEEYEFDMGTGVPPPNRPCDDPRWDYSVCVAENLD